MDGVTIRVFVGALGATSSPVRTFSPLLGAEIVLAAGTSLAFEVDPAFEHGVLVDSGAVSFAGTALVRGELGYVGTGVSRLTISDIDGAGARVVLLGGEPLDEEIVMWWNFVGRTHDDVAAMREDWEAGSTRFGHVEGYSGEPQRLPAPEMPHARLRPRANAPTSHVR
jgi:redox-sensitive bicupin YhaK (pirin superfamily)